MIRVLLAEDQAMMRGALAVLLDLEDDLEVVAQVSDGAEIVPTALEVRPDVALLDIELPTCRVSRPPPCWPRCSLRAAW